MAPRSAAAMKRPAAAAAPQAVAKRPATAAGRAGPDGEAAELQRRCEEVAKVVQASSDYPAPVVELLVSNLSVSLGVPRGIRHPFQEEVAGMIGEVLTKAEDGMQARLAEVEAKLSDATAQRAERERAEQDAVQGLDAKKEATAAAQAAATEAAEALTAAEEASATAEAAQSSRGAELEGLVGQKARLASLFSDAYVPLKEGTSDPAKAQEDVATLLSAGTEFSFDPTLLKALPSAAAKTLSSRGCFDSMVIVQLEQEFKRCTSSLEEAIANAETAKKEADAKAEDTTTAVQSATSAKEKCKASLEEAQAAEKEALTTKRAASKALQQWGPEFRLAQNEAENAKSSLNEFREGPLATYTALLERAQPAPEKPAPGDDAQEAPPESETAQAE